MFKLGQVAGLSNPTINSFRRGAESRVQSSPKMKAAVESLQSHSQKVAVQYYDRSGEDKRASFITQVNTIEDQNDDVDAVPIHVKKRRLVKEKEEREETVNKAKKVLLASKRKKETQNAKCKILPQDREFLQKYFASAEDLDPSKAFPGKPFL